MNKREKAAALAARHEMISSGITASQVLRFATNREVHGFYKGVFFPSGRPANLYTLIARIRERQKPNQPAKRGPCPRDSRGQTTTLVLTSVQMALAF